MKTRRGVLAERGVGLGLGIMTVILALVMAQSARAQAEPPAWEGPTNLFETNGRASEAEVVVDRAGVVHVVWAYAEPDGEEYGWNQAIYYARQEGGAWSTPIDVVVSPGGRVARMPNLVVDADGYLDMVWSGSNAIFYSRAAASEAGSAHGWSYPEALVADVGVVEPAIAADAKGGLYVVWTQFSSGLMFAKSLDGGVTWSEPDVIFVADGDSEAARWGRIAVDGLGRLHVALTHTVIDADAEGRNDPYYLYYLASADGGATWSLPYLVADEPNFGEINVATGGDNTVHLAWNGRAGRHGRYHRVSLDGGQTWGPTDEFLAPAPKDPLGNGGLTGFPVMAVDALGTLHLISTTAGGDYYFRWRAGAWDKPQLISPGIEGSGVTGTDSSVEQPSVALGLGNQLHVVFHDGFERIWHTARRIDAPAETPVPDAATVLLPTPTPQPQPEDVRTAVTPTGSPAVSPTPVVLKQEGVLAQTPKFPTLAVSFAPAALLIGLVVAARLARSRGR